MIEPMHRIKYTKVTREQIDRKLMTTAGGPTCASAFSDILAGKSLKIVTDSGPVLSYAFNGKNKLTVAENSDVGALARNAGFYEVKRFLGPKGKEA